MPDKQTREAVRKNANATSNVSTGTPDSQRQNRADHQICQVPGRSLNGCPGAGGFHLELGFGLADLESGRFAGGIESSVTLDIPLLDALLAHLVDIGARLA